MLPAGSAMTPVEKKNSICWLGSFFFLSSTFFFFFHTQHHNTTSIQNTTKQQTHTPYSKSPIKRERRERERKKKKKHKSFLYIIMYVKEKTLPSINILLFENIDNALLSILPHVPYIQIIEIALLSDPWCIQITLNTNSRT